MFCFSRYFVLLVLAVAAYRTSAYNTAVQASTDWWDGPFHYFQGYCDLPIDKSYPTGGVTVDLLLDTPSESIQVSKIQRADKIINNLMSGYAKDVYNKFQYICT